MKDLSDTAAILAAFEAERDGAWFEVEKPQRGDVVWCSILGAESHVGIFSPPGYLLHVLGDHDSQLQRIDGLVWQRRIVSYFRHKQVGTLSA